MAALWHNIKKNFYSLKKFASTQVIPGMLGGILYFNQKYIELGKSIFDVTVLKNHLATPYLLYMQFPSLMKNMLYFSSKEFYWHKASHLFVDIGSGHGEILLAWSLLVYTYPELFWDPLIKQTLLETDFLDDVYPVVIGFEIKSRYFRALQYELLLRFRLFNRIHPFLFIFKELMAPRYLIFKEDGFAATKKFVNNSVSGFFVLFPDPWNKKKHKKRRKVTATWLYTAFLKLKPSGFILITTDHADYANFIKNQVKELKQQLGEQVTIRVQKGFNPVEWGLPPTHYYKKRIEGGPVYLFLVSKRKRE